MLNKSLQELSFKNNEADNEINKLNEIIKKQSTILQQLEETKENLEINAIKDINVITKINGLNLKTYSESANNGSGGDVDFCFYHVNYNLIILYTNRYAFIFTNSTNKANNTQLNNIYSYLYIIELSTNKILTTNYINLTIDNFYQTYEGFPFCVSNKDENTIVMFYIDNVINYIKKIEITNEDIANITTDFDNSFITLIKNKLNASSNTNNYTNKTGIYVIKTDEQNKDIITNISNNYYLQRSGANIGIYDVINNTNLAQIIYCKNSNSYYCITNYSLTYAQKGLTTDHGAADLTSSCIMYVFDDTNKNFYLIGYQDIDQFSVEMFGTDDLIYEAFSSKDNTYTKFNFLRFCRHDSNEIFLNPWDNKTETNNTGDIKRNIIDPTDIIGITCLSDNNIYSFKFDMINETNLITNIQLKDYETEEYRFKATITGYHNSLLVYQTKNNINFVSFEGDLMVFNSEKGVWISYGKLKDESDTGSFVIQNARNNYGDVAILFTYNTEITNLNYAYIISPKLPAIINGKPSQIIYYKNEL